MLSTKCNAMQCNLIQCESRFGLMWCANDIISFAYKFCFRSTKYTKPLCVRVSVCVRISMLHQQFDPSHPLLHSFTLYFTPRKCFKLQIKFRHCNQLAIATNLPCSSDRICTFFTTQINLKKKVEQILNHKAEAKTAKKNTSFKLKSQKSRGAHFFLSFASLCKKMHKYFHKLLCLMRNSLP